MRKAVSGSRLSWRRSPAMGRRESPRSIYLVLAESRQRRRITVDLHFTHDSRSGNSLFDVRVTDPYEDVLQTPIRILQRHRHRDVEDHSGVLIELHDDFAGPDHG